ncbi:RidA family protein [Enterococcus sp. LJL98]
MKRKIYTGKNIASSGPYSHAVDSGDFIYFSGQTAYNGQDYQGEKYDIATQAQKCFDYLEDVMEAANVSLEQVVKVNVYLTSMQHFDAMNTVYQSRFSKPYPARTCVAVYELPLGADIEIECIVKK